MEKEKQQVDDKNQMFSKIRNFGFYPENLNKALRLSLCEYEISLNVQNLKRIHNKGSCNGVQGYNYNMG